MLSPEVLKKLEAIGRRFEELTHALSDPAVASSGERYKKVSKERASLEPTVEALRAWQRLTREIADNEAMLADSDMRELAKEELAALRPQLERFEEQVKVLLIPRDPNDDKNVIVEVRAGAGGDEAGLFAAELLRLYIRYAERRGWKVDLLDTSPGGVGGIKDATLTISGDAVYSWLKYESGVHRVQRVPATEAQGRIHTSTATVAVMPEAEEVDIQISPADLEVDVFRSTGAGGQSVNTTDSAVRMTHKPTGVIVKCQQEKSQLKNRAMALKMMRAKLFELETERLRSSREADRKSQVGTGDRSEKIRTYNFPQDRLTDHRVGHTRHNLPAVMDGDVQDVIEACRTFFAAEALKEASRGEAGGERRGP
jgi:peptide chain release factor 1